MPSSSPQATPPAAAPAPVRLPRRRLVPLAVLCALVLVASVAGLVVGTPVTPGAPASALPRDPAVKAAERAAKAKRVCQPGYRTGVRSEPWVGARRTASERTFDKRIAQEAPGYVRGKGGWLFFTDYQAQNFSQALGRVTQTKAQEARWVKYIKTSQTQAEAAGARFYAVVAPANWEVYPGRLPTWAQQLRGSTSLDHLLRDHPELPWIDTRSALAKAAKKNDTYEPLDSHWTPYGGYVAWKAITNCLGTADKALKPLDVPQLTGVTTVPGSNEFAGDGVKTGKAKRTVPVYAAPHPASTSVHLPDGAPVATGPDAVTDTVQGPLLTTTPAAQMPDETLLVLRDSTGNSLSPLWSNSFGCVVEYPHGIGQSGLRPPDVAAVAAAQQPDVVMLVITERFLSYPAPR